MRRTIPLFLLLCSLLAACGRTAPAQSSVPSSTPAPVANAPTEGPTAAPEPSATPKPTVPPPTATILAPTVPVATLTSELSATVVAALPPTPTAVPGQDAPLFGGITSVNVLPLNVPDGQEPLWAVSSVGFPDIERNQHHFVAIYRHTDGGWNELARYDVENADALFEGGVEQVKISPDRVWLLVQSGVGAHSGCLDLLSFTDQGLQKEAAGCNSSPVAGFVQDLDGDGFDELILNGTENYVFCYACGERYYSYQVLRWDGNKMQPLDLKAAAGEGKPGEPLHDALVLANLGLWKDAQRVVSQAAQGSSERLTKLYAATIDLHARDFADQVQNAPYPLLDHLFYGEYKEALDVLRAYQPEQLFAKPSPLITDTIAEGWDGQLTYWITDTTTPLIDSNIGDSIDDLPAEARSIDTLAAAHFLRGWALTLSDPPAPEAIADIEQAAQLKPDDQFFQAAVLYLKRQR